MTFGNSRLMELPEPAWRQERRSRIVAAATELFNKAPYNTVQMDDIARLAGVGKPTLYRYFPAKEELFLAVFDNLLSDLEAALEAVLHAGGPAEVLIAGVIRVLVAHLSSRLASLSVLGGDHAGVAVDTHRRFAARRQSLLALLARTIRQGQRVGAFTDMDVEATAPILLGLIRGSLLAAPDLAPERIAAATTALVLHGALKPRTPTA